MEYIIGGIFIIVGITIGAILLQRTKKNKVEPLSRSFLKIQEQTETKHILSGEEPQEFIIQVEMLPADDFQDMSKLIEITDNKMLAHINNLIPGFAQVGNTLNNTFQAVEANGEVLYRAILPTGVKLSNSRTIEGASKGIYHGANGIKGHADWVVVKSQKGKTIAVNTAAATISIASMVVGQYYMTKINIELGEISDRISQISDFQDDEYRSRVFSLITHMKKIADFQMEILENDELRISKISQLDNFEEECTQLLGQANLTLARIAKKESLDYATYEKELQKTQNWYIYQKLLLEVLYKIANLKYALHLGTVSREQCTVLPLIYNQQVVETQSRLISWHKSITERLGINVNEIRRKRTGIDGAVHFLPGLFVDDWRFRSISKSTADMITTQISGYENVYNQDTSDLYTEDVQLITKEGKIYYFLASNEKS